jgi:hypothetical protein
MKPCIALFGLLSFIYFLTGCSKDSGGTATTPSVFDRTVAWSHTNGPTGSFIDALAANGSIIFA